MLLRIIDKPGSENEGDSLEVVFSDATESQSLTCQYFPFLESAELGHSFGDCFKRHNEASTTPENVNALADEMFSLGEKMGQRIFGDEIKMRGLKQCIDNDDLNQLEVRFESSRLGFFDELWEVLVLPGCQTSLSLLAGGFVRCFTGNNIVSHETELELELSKTLPLTLLHIISHFENHTSNCFVTNTELLCLDGAINYEIWPLVNWSDLEERLSSDESPIHIVYFEGLIEIKEDKPNIVFASDDSNAAGHEHLSVEEFVRCLSQNNSTLFSANVHSWTQNGHELDANTCLAWLAKITAENGLPGLLGLAGFGDALTKTACFNLVYKNIAGGLSVSQAVTEAGKQLGRHDSQVPGAADLMSQSYMQFRYYENKHTLFFAEPQQLSDLQETESYLSIRQRLHGFRSEYLPPYIYSAGDGAFVKALQLSLGSPSLLITAKEGLGKTHLCHQLAFHLLQSRFSHAFFFDYENFCYQSSDMLEMIAPVLSLNDKSQVLEELSDKPSFFVLDNFAYAEDIEPVERDENSTAELLEFLNELKKRGHFIVVTDKDGDCGEKLLDVTAELSMSVLTAMEQDSLFQQAIAKNRVKELKKDDDYYTLLSTLGGNPFLTVKLAPMLLKYSTKDLLTQLNEQFFKLDVSDEVERFYLWQWNRMDSIWKRWLLLLYELPEVLLEMLGVACDTPDRSDAVNNLFLLLGDEEAKFSEGLQVIDRAGFVLSYPHGKVIHPRCLSFLQKQLADDELFAEHLSKLNVLLSQVLCEGLRKLIVYTQKQPNQIITQNLLANRGIWARHLEQLWFSDTYSDFIGTLSHLENLLNQNKLGPELLAWSKALLEQSGEMQQVDESKLEYTVAWLKLASNTILFENSTNATLQHAEVMWMQWLNSLNSEQVPEKSALLFHVLQFLELYYRSNQDWSGLKKMAEVSSREYRNHQVWPRLVPHLGLLAECCFKLGDDEHGLLYENELLNDIPFDDFPPGFKSQLLIKVIHNRISRTDIPGAQELLDLLKDSPESENMDMLLDTLQADIFYSDEKKEDAAILYCQIWKLAAEKSDAVNTDYIRQQFARLKEELGEQLLMQIFEQHSGEKAEALNKILDN